MACINDGLPLPLKSKLMNGGIVLKAKDQSYQNIITGVSGDDAECMLFMEDWERMPLYIPREAMAWLLFKADSEIVINTDPLSRGMAGSMSQYLETLYSMHIENRCPKTPSEAEQEIGVSFAGYEPTKGKSSDSADAMYVNAKKF